jgi:hypothetical protein
VEEDATFVSLSGALDARVSSDPEFTGIVDDELDSLTVLRLTGTRLGTVTRFRWEVTRNNSTTVQRELDVDGCGAVLPMLFAQAFGDAAGPAARYRVQDFFVASTCP